MKGESRPRSRRVRSREDAEALAAQAFGRLVDGEDRLGGFLALSGLDPRSLREAASSPEFLPAVLDHVCQDEGLLLAIANEIDVDPTALAAASHLLSGARAFDD